MKRQKPKRNSNRPRIEEMGPGQVSDLDLGDFFVPVEEYHVLSWSPGDAEKGDPCTQVHFLLPMPDVGASILIRLKSKQAVQDLIDTLTKHRDDVWPDDVSRET